jgi:hypothetical protein
MNLLDHKNIELRFSILSGNISPVELVKMSSEELAPSSLKKRRVERQNKYFQEQVLMKEETKIIAKTNKGESLLSGADNIDNKEDPFITSDQFIFTNNVKKDENNSDKASWDYQSDNEERNRSINNINQQDNIIRSRTSGQDVTRTNSSQLIKSLSGTRITEQKKGEKYKNLSVEMVELYKALEDMNRSTIINKLNEKLKNHLKPSSIAEINELRNKI